MVPVTRGPLRCYRQEHSLRYHRYGPRPTGGAASGHWEGGQQGWGRGWEAGWEQVGSLKDSPWTGKGMSLLWVPGPLSRGDGDLGKALL